MTLRFPPRIYAKQVQIWTVIVYTQAYQGQNVISQLWSIFSLGLYNGKSSSTILLFLSGSDAKLLKIISGRFPTLNRKNEMKLIWLRMFAKMTTTMHCSFSPFDFHFRPTSNTGTCCKNWSLLTYFMNNIFWTISICIQTSKISFWIHSSTFFGG